MSHSDKKLNRSNPARIAAGAEIARLTDENYSNRKKLAEDCGIKIRTFYDLLAGRKKVDADLAKRLAPALEVDRQYLLGLETRFRNTTEQQRTRSQFDEPDFRPVKDQSDKAGKCKAAIKESSPPHIAASATSNGYPVNEARDALPADQTVVSEEAMGTRCADEALLHRKKKIFVAMPFTEEFTDFYELGVRQTAEKLGYECERIDEVEFNSSISQKIINRIEEADILVAEVSKQNANVYYELAWAQAKGKPTILCTKDVENLPFDTRDLNHIVYSTVYSILVPLEKRLRSI